MSSLRDISLLPTVYKSFAKCLVNRLLPIIVETALYFWQHAYIKEGDRQELIFCLETAIDDFKHRSSKFYTSFVDFRDAFGSLDQNDLIRTLLEVGIHKDYCLLIADIYQESHFQVICRNEHSKEYLLTVGTKTGCPLSAVLFVIQLDRSLKEVHSHAIISLNIKDEKRVSPIPVMGYADDIAFVTILEKVLRDMFNILIQSTAPSGLKIRPDKCSIFYKRRSGNRWYKAKSNKPPEIEINGEVIEVLQHNEPFMYLGKPLTVAGELHSQWNDLLQKYKELLSKIEKSLLPIALPN